MARSKQPRSLSGTAAEHRSAWERAKLELLANVQDAKDAMGAGNCLNTGQAVDEAYIAYGQMLAHADTGPETSETVHLLRAIKEADEPFESKCVRSEPEELTRTRMAWARPGLAGADLGRTRAPRYVEGEFHGRVELRELQWVFITHMAGKLFTWPFEPALAPGGHPRPGAAVLRTGFGDNAHNVIVQRGVVVGEGSANIESLSGLHRKRCPRAHLGPTTLGATLEPPLDAKWPLGLQGLGATLQVALPNLPKHLQEALRKRNPHQRTVTLDVRQASLIQLAPREEYDSRYDHFDPGHHVFAVSLTTGEEWSQSMYGQAPSLFPVEARPVAIVTIRRSGSTAVVMDEAGAALIARGQPETLNPYAAMLLWLMVHVRSGKYRNDAVADFKRRFPGAPYGIGMDALLERSLVKVAANGAMTVTPRGQELGSKLPRTYSDASWRYGTDQPSMENITLSGAGLAGSPRIDSILHQAAAQGHTPTAASHEYVRRVLHWYPHYSDEAIVGLLALRRGTGTLGAADYSYPEKVTLP